MKEIWFDLKQSYDCSQNGIYMLNLGFIIIHQDVPPGFSALYTQLLDTLEITENLQIQLRLEAHLKLETHLRLESHSRLQSKLHLKTHSTLQSLYGHIIERR